MLSCHLAMARLAVFYLELPTPRHRRLVWGAVQAWTILFALARRQASVTQAVRYSFLDPGPSE